MTQAITIVNLNPCIDWQYNIPKFTHGGMNRVRHTYNSASGKGMNVAVALKNLGITPTCIGFNFAEGGAQVTGNATRWAFPTTLKLWTVQCV